MSGETVLVVEDNEDIQLTMRLSLELSGYRVLTAATAEDALEVLRSETPDVVLLDLTLPGMDGWEMLATMRGAGALSGLPVIVVSGHTGDEVARRAAALRASHLTKPFDIAVLNSAVREAIPGAGRD